jgi:hypothetical protein
MNGFPRRLPAAAFLTVALLASAARPAMAARTAVGVRLLSPGDGAVLKAGSLASLEWTPAAALSGPDRFEEWEAFLSLDGGASYPVRLTPHLDRELRRITFKVPVLPTGNARLLLRVGDERQETAFELPERFTIAAPPGSLPSALDLPQTVSRRGEAARPGEPGVLVWVEGRRSGGAMREVRAEEPARGIGGTENSAEAAQGRPAPAAVASEEPPSGAPASDLGVLAELHPPRTGSAAHPLAAPPAPTDILLLIQRQNE